jgi:hypothetical protein
MQRNIMGLFFTLAIAATLCSCKKEAALPAETALPQPAKEQLQSWYTGQTAKGQPDGDKIKFFLNAGTPDWDNAKQVGNSYFTPVTINGNKGQSQKILVTSIAANGNLASGKYVYVIKNKAAAAAVPYSLVNEILETQKAPADFSGSIVEYNLKHEFIAAASFVNGKLDAAKVVNVNSRPKSGNAAASKGPDIVPNVANACEGVEGFCIDWYWQTFINGILVDEEYLGTTCYCGQGGGGGSGNNNINAGPCNLTAAQAQVALNTITGESSTSYYSVMGTPKSPDANGIIRASVTRRGGGIRLNFAPGYNPRWVSTYAGVVYKDSNIPNDPWKWESLTAKNFIRDEGILPPCVAVNMTYSLAPPVISADGLSAHTTGTCSALVNWSCLNGLEIKTVPGSFGSYFPADYISQ